MYKYSEQETVLTALWAIGATTCALRIIIARTTLVYGSNS